jgi:hypothetical protein
MYQSTSPKITTPATMKIQRLRLPPVESGFAP